MFWRGAQDGLPFVIVIGPFGLLFGVVATEAGLDLLQTMAMTSLVIAGAAQFSAVAILQEGGPSLVAVGVGLAVNLRMAMYSVSMVPHLGGAPLGTRALIAYLMVDQTYGTAIRGYAERPMTLPQKVAYFFGTAAPIVPLWYAMTLLGALLGEAIPEEVALDFAIPITFIALFAPLLRSPPHIVAAFVSVAGALALAWVPYQLGLMVAALAAMTAGALTEAALERR